MLVIAFLTGQEEETTAADKIPTIVGSGMNYHREKRFCDYYELNLKIGYCMTLHI